jgi:hypothetical protein
MIAIDRTHPSGSYPIKLIVNRAVNEHLWSIPPEVFNFIPFLYGLPSIANVNPSLIRQCRGDPPGRPSESPLSLVPTFPQPPPINAKGRERRGGLGVRPLPQLPSGFLCAYSVPLCLIRFPLPLPFASLPHCPFALNLPSAPLPLCRKIPLPLCPSVTLSVPLCLIPIPLCVFASLPLCVKSSLCSSAPLP